VSDITNTLFTARRSSADETEDNFLLDIVLDIAFSAWIISTIFILYDADRSANRNGSNKAVEMVAIPCCTVLLIKGL